MAVADRLDLFEAVLRGESVKAEKHLPSSATVTSAGSSALSAVKSTM
jgi:hypothetical protein